MFSISVVRDTSHLEISPLKAGAILKIEDMSLMLDTSHAHIAPCWLLGRLPISDDWRHKEIPCLRSSLDCGENAAVRVRFRVRVRIRISVSVRVGFRIRLRVKG